MAPFIKYVHDIKPRQASGLVEQIYAQMTPENAGVHEPFRVHAPIPDLLAGIWAMFRETQLTGRVKRGYKEAVAYGVAQLNRCPWCIDAHQVALYGSHRQGIDEHYVTSRWQDGTLERGDEPYLDAVMMWVKATRQPGSAVLQAPPFAASEAPELIGAVVLWNYINRVTNVMITGSPLPQVPRLKRSTMRVLGLLFGWFFMNKQLTAGRSLQFLSDVPLPVDLAWSGANPHIARACAGMARSVDDAAAQFLPERVRLLVQTRLQAWQGEELGLSRAWVEHATRDLVEDERPIGRLALLTALASYQVDDEVVTAFRKLHPTDQALVGVVAWASFAAARRIGTWLSPADLRPELLHTPLQTR